VKRLFDPRRLRTAAALACAAAAVSLAACDVQERAGSVRMFRAGDAAPAFAGATLAGDSISLDGLRGEAVMLNVWATWCIPCREEMPALEALHRRYEGRGLRIVGVSIDASGVRGDVQHFVDEHDITFTIVHDPAERVSRAFRTIGVPETFLIDRDGTIVRRWIGKFDPLAADVIRDVDLALEG
jgi:cytochrome c biogenesis protein CcmG, thiol:disulfide interchange protein DsbE